MVYGCGHVGTNLGRAAGRDFLIADDPANPYSVDYGALWHPKRVKFRTLTTRNTSRSGSSRGVNYPERHEFWKEGCVQEGG
jgi:hypothetical protein